MTSNERLMILKIARMHAAIQYSVGLLALNVEAESVKAKLAEADKTMDTLHSELIELMNKEWAK